MKAKTMPQSPRKANRGSKSVSRQPNSSLVIVRSLAPEDFEFVRSLAAAVTGYTVCPPYVLWMLSRFHGHFCAVAVAPDQTRLGYLLAMPASDPAAAVFVWQLTATFRGRRLKAQDQLVAYLKDTIRARGISQVLFTSIPNSAAESSVRALAKRIFSAAPQIIQNLPKSVSQEEREYGFFVSSTKRMRGTSFRRKS
jgi:hypothetical protein